jgi:hypothetical protein
MVRSISTGRSGSRNDSRDALRETIKPAMKRYPHCPCMPSRNQRRDASGCASKDDLFQPQHRSQLSSMTSACTAETTDTSAPATEEDSILDDVASRLPMMLRTCLPYRACDENAAQRHSPHFCSTSRRYSSSRLLRRDREECANLAVARS